jgi:hypothetical protein
MRPTRVLLVVQSTRWANEALQMEASTDGEDCVSGR